MRARDVARLALAPALLCATAKETVMLKKTYKIVAPIPRKDDVMAAMKRPNTVAC